MIGLQECAASTNEMNPLTAARIHLVLCHVPVMAAFFGSALLALGLWRVSQDLQKSALGMFLLAGVVAVPLYLTGEPAAAVVRPLPEYSDSTLVQHQTAGAVALAGCIVLAIAALAGLLLLRGKALAPRFAVPLLVGALLVCGLTVWTSTLGGEIRHSEVRAEAAPESP